MYALSKLGIALITPLGVYSVLTALGLALLILRWWRLGRSLVTAGSLWLLLWSLPTPSIWLCARVEQAFPQRPAAAYPVADAIVLLGGGMRGRRTGWLKRPELSFGGDRLWFAAQLYRAARAPWVIVAAGGDPSDGQIEADATAEFLEDLGVPASALLLDTQSHNTWENALYSQTLMREHGLRTVLLVTSALHMPRALATFRKRGIDSIPAPADFVAPPEGPWPQRWLPNADALEASSRAFKEYIGLWAYRLCGLV